MKYYSDVPSVYVGPMSRSVLFLGAGASAAFGMPLTNGIMPTIVKRLKNSELYDDVIKYSTLEAPNPAKDRASLARYLQELAPGYEAIDLKHLPVTDILSLLDYMLLSAFVPAPQDRHDDLVNCRVLIERGILEILGWPYDPSSDADIPPDLVKIGRWMYRQGEQEAGFALISTNYDELFETELYRHLIKEVQAAASNNGQSVRPFDIVNRTVNFGLSWRDCPTGEIFNPPSKHRYSILKLHGSVHWMKCDLCGWIVCNDDYNFHNLAPHVKMFDRRNTCGCGHWPLQSVVMAPSFVRDIRDPNILSVWRNAFEELRVADQWYFIGYSLP